jgi:hypothetical protein
MLCRTGFKVDVLTGLEVDDLAGAFGVVVGTAALAVVFATGTGLEVTCRRSRSKGSSKSSKSISSLNTGVA